MQPLQLVTRVAQTQIPNSYGRWAAYGYRSDIDGAEHLALVLGDIGDGEDMLTRVHSECLTGDVFGSQRCDCGAQLDAAMAKIAERVDMKINPSSKMLFDLAQPFSLLMQSIETGAFNTPLGAELLGAVAQAPDE